MTTAPEHAVDRHAAVLRIPPWVPPRAPSGPAAAAPEQPPPVYLSVVADLGDPTRTVVPA